MARIWEWLVRGRRRDRGDLQHAAGAFSGMEEILGSRGSGIPGGR